MLLPARESRTLVYSNACEFEESNAAPQWATHSKSNLVQFRSKETHDESPIKLRMAAALLAIHVCALMSSDRESCRDRFLEPFASEYTCPTPTRAFSPIPNSQRRPLQERLEHGNRIWSGALAG